MKQFLTHFSATLLFISSLVHTSQDSLDTELLPSYLLYSQENIVFSEPETEMLQAMEFAEASLRRSRGAMKTLVACSACALGAQVVNIGTSDQASPVPKYINYALTATITAGGLYLLLEEAFRYPSRNYIQTMSNEPSQREAFCNLRTKLIKSRKAQDYPWLMITISEIKKQKDAQEAVRTGN